MFTDPRKAAASLAVLAIAAPGATSTALAAGKHHAAAHHHAHHRHRHHRHHANGIPQHNGGDHDFDNNGSPSDNDGNI